MASSPELTLWRLVRPEHAPGLDGKGAELYGGRWNAPGRRAVYCAAHLSLAALEYFVHLPPPMRRPDTLPLMTVVRLSLPDAGIERLDPSVDQLADPEWCRAAGDGWLGSGRTLGLSVPSAVIPVERNVVLNPAHADFGLVRVQSAEPFRFDVRMGT